MQNPQEITKKGPKKLSTGNVFYSDPFLQSHDCNSSSFLREISYKVNLTELYKVVGSCYNNNQMQFCPIMVKIMNHALLKDYKCKYLLQVWDDGGKLVFIRPLHNQVRLWNISNEFFIFRPQTGDQNSSCFHITDLTNGNSTLLVKDPINDPSFIHLAFNDGILYVANSNMIYLLNCKEYVQEMQPQEQWKVDLKKEEIHRITPGLPIHDLFNYKFNISKNFQKSLVMVAFETDDSQIDFSQIIPQNLGSKEFTYILKQQRELLKRDVKFDPIAKFTYIITQDNMFYGVTLRKSGCFDIYWNMTLVDSPVEIYANDISSTFDTLYLKMESGDIKAIYNRAGPSINFEQSSEVQDDFEFPIIFYQNIKNHVNLYNSFTLFRTTLFIAHGQFVSLFNIQDNKWIKHCKFTEGNIACLVKKKTLSGYYKSKFEIAIVLENGSIYNNMQHVFLSQDIAGDDGNDNQPNQVLIIEQNFRTFQLPGDILKFSLDQQKNYWFSALVRDLDNNIRLFTLHFDKLHEIKIGLTGEIDESCNIVHLFSPTQESYFLIQKYSDLTVYRIQIAKPVVPKEEKDQSSLSVNSQVEDIAILRQIVNLNIQVEGNIHSCITLDVNDHIFFVDQMHFYRYDCNTKVSKIYEDQNCVGIYVVDDKFCYTMSHSSAERKSGLHLYDINNILKKDNDVSYKLSNMQVGFSGVLDWNQDYSRFSILKSLDTLVIVPALHRNTIAFIGMSSRDQYLATKLNKDKFIALDRNNCLFCWSITTGKLLSVNKLEKKDYSGFQVFKPIGATEDKSAYNRNWYGQVLLVKYDAEIDFDENSYAKEDGLVPLLDQQIQFSQSQAMEFREFRLIEIINEVTVKEHLVFIHPYYLDEKQRIYFDSKNQYMLEKLNHPRVFLYKKEKFKKVTQWRYVKRWNKFPEELENESGFMRVLSPSFQHYIQLDRTAHQFVILDTFSNIEIYRIPQFLMNAFHEDHSEIMNRFRWMSDDVIHIINNEGIETVIDMKEKFREIEYNVIPLFDPEEIKDPIRSYFTNRSPLEVSQVKERLIRKYQSYKSAYYLEHKRETYSLYDELFTVDYQIDKCKGMFTADMSFTFLHWQIIEQLKNSNLSIESIDDSQIELLCYNILPGGNTVMHQLTDNGDMIKKIFEIAQPNEEDVSQIAFHIPFFQNLQSKSPLHICFDKQDIKTMDTILSFLAGYDIDHHSRAIADIIPFAIEKELPSLLNYFDSRLCQTQKLQKITKGCLKDDILKITEISLMFCNSEYEEKFLKKMIPGDDTLIERPVKIEFLDIPRIYHYSDEMFNELFARLKRTSQIEIFSKKTIQKLVEFNYALVKKWTIRKLLTPFIMNQIMLYAYLNFVFGIDKPLTNLLDLPMQVALGCFSSYFLYYNCYLQVKHDGWDFLYSVWNYINIITPCTILSVLFINIFKLDIAEENERILQAIGVFFMWYKFLYFFRMSKSYGYLTRLIILVMVDMSTFLFVLFFTIVAFADTFLTISNGNDGTTLSSEGIVQQPFVAGFFDAILYVYLIVLGSFEMQDFQNSIASQILIAFFILCTVFNTIVMLNLLIAIISETFSHVKENAENAQFQEMAGLIADNSYLIPDSVKEKYAKKNKCLMAITDLDTEMGSETNEIMERLDVIRKNTISKIDNLNIILKQITNEDKQLAKLSETQDKEYQQILEMIYQIPGVKLSAEEKNRHNLETVKVLEKLSKNAKIKESTTPVYLATNQVNDTTLQDNMTPDDGASKDQTPTDLNISTFTMKKFNEFSKLFGRKKKDE